MQRYGNLFDDPGEVTEKANSFFEVLGKEI